jgi:hypothetical protein
MSSWLSFSVFKIILGESINVKEDKRRHVFSLLVHYIGVHDSFFTLVIYVVIYAQIDRNTKSIGHR